MNMDTVKPRMHTCMHREWSGEHFSQEKAETQNKQEPVAGKQQNQYDLQNQQRSHSWNNKQDQCN